MTEEIIPFIDNEISLIDELNLLYQRRLINKEKQKEIGIKRIALNNLEREKIFNKTGGLCHVCGTTLDVSLFEADHVKPLVSGGNDIIDNFLPACSKCNNYRWNYSPEEIQWILKLGVWLKTKIQNGNLTKNKVLEEFIQDEINRENRRKNPRKPYTPQVDYHDLLPIKGKFGSKTITYSEIKQANKIIEKYIEHFTIGQIDILNSKSFLITGETNVNRKDLENMIKKKGGIIKTSISKKLNYLIIGNFYGFSKIMKLNIINETENGLIRIILSKEFENTFANII